MFEVAKVLLVIFVGIVISEILIEMNTISKLNLNIGGIAKLPRACDTVFLTAFASSISADTML